MPSTYSNSLRLELQADNENQGNWGSITNRNLGTLLESSISGVRSITLPDTDYTLTALNGSDDEARYAYLIFSGTLTATRNVIVPTPSKLYAVRNATNQSIVIKTATGTGVTVPSGMSTLAYSNGANVLDTLSYVSNLSGNGAGLFSLNASNLASGTIPEARFPASLPSLSGANLTNLNASNLASGIVPDARFPATLPAISGANLTNLNASNLASGTVPDARFPATLPAISGANLTNLNASNLVSGTVPSARLTGSYAISITGNAATASNADLLDNIDSTNFLRVSTNSSSPLNGNFAIGTSGGRNFIQSHGGAPLDINPLGNSVVVNGSGLVLNNGGTYSINITGNAATATSATTAGNGGVTSVNGRTGAVSVSENIVTATGGSPPYYAARAWVNFNSIGTVSIRASVNVSSITDNGIGDFTVNFATAMPDENFVPVMNCNHFGRVEAAGSHAVLYGSNSGGTQGTATMTAGSVRMHVYAEQAGDAARDALFNFLSVYR